MTGFRKAAAASLAALATACVLAVPVDSRAGSPPPDAFGRYAGRAAWRNSPLDPENRRERGVVSARLEVLPGEGLSVALEVDTDEGTEEFLGRGLYGNGQVWFVFEDGEGLMVLAGTVKGSPGRRKIRAAGQMVSAQEVLHLKVALKEIAGAP